MPPVWTGPRLLLIGAALCGCAPPPRPAPAAHAPRLVVPADTALVDARVRVGAEGLRPGEAAALVVRWPDAPGGALRSIAWFRADVHGRIDASVQAPDSGSYAESDAMGLFWSMERDSGAARSPSPWAPPAPLAHDVELRVDGRVVERRPLVRALLAPGVRREEVRSDALTGRLYLPPGRGPHPLVVVLGGSEGGFDDLRASALASRGYAALAVAYFGLPGLPGELFAVPVERVEAALEWARTRPGLDAGRVALLGTSKGAELALLAATRLPRVRAVVAYAPTDAVQQGVTREGRSRPESSWSLGGEPVPFLLQRPSAEWEAQFRRAPPYTLRTLYEASRADTAALAGAAIPVERIRGAVLLLSGADDQMIPAAEGAESVVRRLRAHRHPRRAEHHSFPGAGHSILVPYLPTPPRTAGGFWRAGGTPAGYARADRESWAAVLAFLGRELR
ncbi:acyl-CoA thioester hydrolase/BAAT C-terminal domain-containing protein [Longimicrobium sp.]|jgi:dienelactone hydrolase|uniref:acyl-CoA thioester hydrolase/BAAT C-terminal domain-containing protein n=1 Tax=Longimicrobium sp. TaxID=2029185 RepID=UPI002ED9EB52